MPWNFNRVTQLLANVIISPPWVDPVPTTKAKWSLPPKHHHSKQAIFWQSQPPLVLDAELDIGLPIAVFDKLLASSVSREATSQLCAAASPSHLVSPKYTQQHLINHRSVVFTTSQPSPLLHSVCMSQLMEHNSTRKWTLVLQPLSSAIPCTKQCANDVSNRPWYHPKAACIPTLERRLRSWVA